ncbi:phosphonoacetaldehyde hydrolase [Bifidobacterium lemurum]|uniref:Phosphonoacetaldehyde hydrolase n=1 Tax=Bifidobacterium lemurum TaxID=1603886 RepID=A0A261FSM4_9BIFI|nr:phosphonoacetaldehyde hydrolase [Bifidobacterium lemurum]OZG62200.1 phosphonoacetaldehyde hydrolase [Bifidobacterium lemurum]QOL33573.1 phosphonoacetaldehyde hydrolase [Bifidobacterium lemurum]
MISRFDAVIFDWAGTTVDYGCFAPVAAFQETFREFGMDPTMDETRAPMGMLKWDHIKTMLAGERLSDQWTAAHAGSSPTDADVDAMYAVYEPKLLSILDHYADPKPGVLDAVASLREQGLRIGSTTGFTDSMMAIVAPKAAERGYAPDCWITPDSTDGFGRPYPYMVFANMRALRLPDVRRVAKVGDTISDVREGKAAGCFTIAVTEGSSQMGFGESEFEALSPADRQSARDAARDAFLAAGADAVIDTMAELPVLLSQLG